jgi:hypothetical protein
MTLHKIATSATRFPLPRLHAQTWSMPGRDRPPTGGISSNVTAQVDAPRTEHGHVVAEVGGDMCRVVGPPLLT